MEHMKFCPSTRVGMTAKGLSCFFTILNSKSRSVFSVPSAFPQRSLHRPPPVFSGASEALLVVLRALTGQDSRTKETSSMATLSSRRSCDGLLPLTLFSSLGTSGLNSSVGGDGKKKKQRERERGGGKNECQTEGSEA